MPIQPSGVEAPSYLPNSMNQSYADHHPVPVSEELESTRSQFEAVWCLKSLLSGNFNHSLQIDHYPGQLSVAKRGGGG
jgi:hypothetical protein